MDVVVPSAEVMPAASVALAAAGYSPEGDLGIPGREAFGLPPELVHYHLRGDAVDRERYAARKRELAHLLTTDRAAYVDGKSALVDEMLARARGSR